MDWTVATYVAYLLISVPLTIWVAQTLFRHGQVFLDDVFADTAGLARAVNRLLVVGFYLLNLGFVSLFLRIGGQIDDARGLLEALSVKIGVVSVVLGLMHFLNVYVFNALRRRNRLEALRVPPVPPQGFLASTGGTPAPYPAP